MGNRHHFVPRFYLSAFESSPRRIHLFNLSRNRVVADASLRDQCQVHRLYGSDVVESALAAIEGSASALIRRMRDHQAVPGMGTIERDQLLLFVALQLARTTAAQAHAMQSSQLMANIAFDGAPPKEYEMSADEAIAMTLAVAPIMAATIADLAITLVQAEPDSCFVTSDDPVFKYNAYCEGITDFGVTGTKCRGLQLFLPVSPRYLLYLFDAGVYKLVRAPKRLASANTADMMALNRLQLIGARNNVYFDDEGLSPWIAEAAVDVRTIRSASAPRVTKAVDVNDSRAELLHQYWSMPQAGLLLSFVSFRRNALKVPLFDRIHRTRGAIQGVVGMNDAEGTLRRFEVPSHH